MNNTSINNTLINKCLEILKREEIKTMVKNMVKDISGEGGLPQINFGCQKNTWADIFRNWSWINYSKYNSPIS